MTESLDGAAFLMMAVIGELVVICVLCVSGSHNVTVKVLEQPNYAES